MITLEQIAKLSIEHHKAHKNFLSAVEKNKSDGISYESERIALLEATEKLHCAIDDYLKYNEV